MINRFTFFAVHAVDSNLYFTRAPLKRGRLECDCEIQVDQFEWSQKDISNQEACEFLPDDIIQHFHLSIILEGNSFIFLQQNRFLPAELHHDWFVPFGEWLHYVHAKIAIVDRHQESP